MVKCAIEGCANYQGKRQTDGKLIKFLSFPKDLRLRLQWIAACGGRDILNIRIARVCSDHFTDQDWNIEHLLLNVSENKKRLKSGAVPTQNLSQKHRVEEIRKTRKVCSDSDATSYQNIEGYRRTVSDSDEENLAGTFILVDESQSPFVSCTSENEELGTDQTVHDFNNLHSLRQENSNLRVEVSKLLKRVRKAESFVTDMRQFFTKAQIKRLQNPQKNCYWNIEDIASSLSLYTASPLMYRMMWARKYPLPSPSTLRKWTATLKLRPGMIISTIKTLSDCSYNEKERLCVLALYEIRLKPTDCCSLALKTGMRPYKYAQVFIMRGLLSEWKHIIYYNFDCMMPMLVIQDIIRTLRDINFTVVALVSGVGPRKVALWQSLRIDEYHPSFEVFEGERVFFFANVPHLIKRLRNHFLTKGLKIKGTLINVEPLNELLAVQSAELWVSHDLTKAHISPKRVKRHNLQVALQLFSISVAKAIRKGVALGKMKTTNAIECSDFIQVVDEWIGLFNSTFMAEEGGRGPMAYGMALKEQNAKIASMNELMKTLAVNESDGRLYPLQKGIQLNNNSLPRLHKYLEQKHNISYVITNNLNADDIEHSFGLRQSLGGVAQKPTPLEFKYRLRSGILVNLSVEK